MGLEGVQCSGHHQAAPNTGALASGTSLPVWRPTSFLPGVASAREWQVRFGHLLPQQIAGQNTICTCLHSSCPELAV